MINSNFVDIENKILRLDDVNIDVRDIRMNALKFTGLLILNENEIYRDISKIVEARRLFETCLTQIISLTDPEKNEYIEKINETNHSFDAFMELLGNANAIIDSQVMNFLDKIEKKRELFDNPIMPIMLESARQKLLDYLENFILNPLILAYNKFIQLPKTIEKDGKKTGITKDSKLFTYFLFKELYKCAEIKGSAIRQASSLSTTGGIKFNETNYIKQGKIKQNQTDENQYVDTSPPEIPENIHFDPFADTEEEVI